MKKNLINRKTYKRIKKMDRQEMEQFLATMYQDSFKEGVRSGENADFRIKLSKLLEETKGVGPKLYDRIMRKAKEME